MRRGSGCCRAARWTKDFRLRPSGFEGEGVVLEQGDLSGEARYGYPRIGGIAGRQEPLVVPGRHRPVDGRPVPQEDAHRRRDAPGDAAPPPGPLVPKEEQGRCRGDQGAGDGQRKILNPQPEGGGGQGAPDQGARAFNPVGSGQCPAFHRVKPGGGAKQEPRDQPDRRERDDERRQLQGKGEVGAGDAAQGHAAGPEEDDAEGKAEGEGDKEVRRPTVAERSLPSTGERPQGGQEKPCPQGNQVDQLDPEGGDVELPEENDLPDQRDESRQQQRDDISDHFVSASLKTSA